jgi:circadian clock protein KaiC
VANVRGGVLSAERQGAAANPADMAAAPAGRASFGLPELDALLDGGLVRDTSTLLAGSVGVGKTAMALHFALAGARAGEPTIYLSFRETIAQLLLRADAFALGPELRRAAADGGTLTFLRFAPIELDPDIMADQLLAVLDRTAARRLVIDSILELERASSRRTGRAVWPTTRRRYWKHSGSGA